MTGRNAVRPVVVVLVAVLAAGAAMSTWGSTARDVGPLDVRVGLTLASSGGTRIVVPPLGRLDFATHAGPLRVAAEVTEIDPDAARSLVRNERPVQSLTTSVAADARAAVVAAAGQSALVALVAAAVVCAVAFRRRRDVLVGTSAVALLLAGSTAVAAVTLRTTALAEPRFTGLLAQAPGLVGRATDFDAYADRVADLTANVSRVYAAGSLLSSAPTDGVTRVLWVSDIHNNPQAFTIMGQVADQFGVAAIVDAGDITDLGSSVENRLIRRAGNFQVPYLYVRGNHDSRGVTQAYLASRDGVTVLDGTTVRVAGIDWAGIGDPLYAPNKRSPADSDRNAARLREAGERLRAVVDDAGGEVDVAVVHEPAMAAPLAGSVPLVLAGHVHERRSRLAGESLLLTQGSTGGAGLRALTDDAPLPIELSVLHFETSTGSLVAVDDITVGGLGERSVTVERRSREGDAS